MNLLERLGSIQEMRESGISEKDMTRRRVRLFLDEIHTGLKSLEKLEFLLKAPKETDISSNAYVRVTTEPYEILGGKQVKIVFDRFSLTPLWAELVDSHD